MYLTDSTSWDIPDLRYSFLWPVTYPWIIKSWFWKFPSTFSFSCLLPLGHIHTTIHYSIVVSLSLSFLLPLSLSLSSTPPPFTVCTPHFPAVFVVCVSFIVGVWFLGVPLCEGAARAYSMTAFFGLSFVAFYSLTLPLFLNSLTPTFDRFIRKTLLTFFKFWGSLAC